MKMNKNAVFVLVFSFASALCSDAGTTMNAFAEVTAENSEKYLTEFFELPLDEIESKLGISRSEANTNKIMVNFSNEQLRKLITELEPQKEEIGNDADLFRTAFFDLFLEKLHLTGIYDTFDPEYVNADLPSAWWNPMHPFVVEESDSGYAYITFSYPDHQKAYAFEKDSETITVDRYEATQRSLYVMNIYGDKDYFSDAYEELSCKSASQVTDNTIDTTTMTTTIGSNSLILGYSGDLNLDRTITVADAILLARILAEDTTVSVTEEGMRNADMNGSGTPDSDDLTLILKQIAGIKD